MINKFINTCLINKNKKAFDYKKAKTFRDLHDDTLKCIDMFKIKGIKEHDKAVLFITPSYTFYVLLLASICYHLNIIVLDSYRNKKNTELIKKVDYIFVNNKTKFLSYCFFNKNIRRFNVSGFNQYSNTSYNYLQTTNDIVLTTYTSGTTGTPKKITRTINDLSNQFEIILSNINIDSNDVVIGMLPIYTLLAIVNGNTTVLTRKITSKAINKYNVAIVLAPIAKLLKVKSPIRNLKKIYCGGAILYKAETEKIKYIFCNSVITYIYGASEGVLIGKTTINEYVKQIFSFNYNINGMKIEIVNKNFDGVGEIVVSGLAVLGVKTHFTGDIGYIKDNMLHIIGRLKYSNLEKRFYNYQIDEETREENPRAKKVFSFYYNGNYYIVYKGKLDKKNKNYLYIKLYKIPTDNKHKTKLNYKKVIDKIQETK
ncbi:MAG: AMP-binding protein [Bacilli bacterium]